MNETPREHGRPGPTVRVESLRMVHGSGPTAVCAIDDVSLQFPAGQFAVIRGRSGSGKTTLLTLLSGLRRATSGRVFVGQTDLGLLRPPEVDRFRRRNIGLVFQFFNLIPSLTVDMNIALPLLLENRKLPDLRDDVGELIDLLGLQRRRAHAPHELSGGEMQRVAIARALMIEPKLILADEPTGNLDRRAAGEIFALLRTAVDKRGVTTVVMTHEVEATSYADRVISLDDGRVIEDSAG